MSEVRAIGLAFMEALWAADTVRADALLAPHATWRFQRGMPQAAIAPGQIWPARDALRRIIADLFGKFDPDGFTIEMSRAVCEGDTLAVEYEAHGRTAGGDDYHGHYVTLLTIAEGRVTEVRPYNDTRYMLAMLDGDAAA